MINKLEELRIKPSEMQEGVAYVRHLGGTKMVVVKEGNKIKIFEVTYEEP